MKKEPHVSVIILAAGKSERFGKGDKLFSKIYGKPLLYYSINQFQKHPLVKSMIIVTQKDSLNLINKLNNRYHFSKISKIVFGGDFRSASVINGINAIDDCNILLIHDAARPNVSKSLIDDSIRFSKKYGAAIPVIKISDTIKYGEKFVEKTKDRRNMYLAQTPQSFSFNWIKKNLPKIKKLSSKHIPDDSFFAEKLGLKVYMFEGDNENLKVTHQKDLKLMRKLMN